MNRRSIWVLWVCVVLLLVSAMAAAEDTFVIPPQFDMAGSFSEGRAVVVSTEGKSGFIDKKGEIAVPTIYDMASDFVDGVSVVSLDGKYGMIDVNGGIVVPLEYDDMDPAFEPGTLIYARKDDLCGFIDTKGDVLIPFEYAGVDSVGFNDGLCAVSTGSSYGYIDETGAEAIPFTFRFAGMFSGLVAPVHNGEKWGLVLRDGEVPLGFVFDEIGWSMAEGIITVL